MVLQVTFHNPQGSGLDITHAFLFWGCDLIVLAIFNSDDARDSL
jgi:hypothetical protein